MKQIGFKVPSIVWADSFWYSSALCFWVVLYASYKSIISNTNGISGVQIKIRQVSCELSVSTKEATGMLFLNDPAYKEAIENSANYNTRLCIERRLRMPFLDSQTGSKRQCIKENHPNVDQINTKDLMYLGVAQNHSNLFMTTRQRIPGLREGQIYTYPSKCWRKKRRQYLSNFMQPRRKEVEIEGDLHTVSVVENLATANEDSKESVSLKDESAKDAWYYDELDMQEMEGFDEPEPDSDYDYEEPYSKRKGKKKSTKVARTVETPAAKKPKLFSTPESVAVCGIRYKTRPGLSYHYTHSHKDRDDEESFGSEGVLSSSDRGAPSPSGSKQAASPVPSDPARAAPSPYCDFCLGDASENKKTGQSEELVSCSDCGRSGHPSCLQFTANMIISVRKYRWQCIECKCCSICGTSDNDDQLLFCDDCDRGYHMYCLSPPLPTPPEGSWSCRLCLVEFHSK
uniref:(California timema) hypothetical protein n=1 Tax=Timema californicum TaxID=61474 RepID=A0A7R9J6A2_TIMCA|nr:unnamed protein product [Timema californicum]